MITNQTLFKKWLIQNAMSTVFPGQDERSSYPKEFSRAERRRFLWMRKMKKRK